MNERSLEWSAPEFHYYHKTELWYWAVAGITGLIILLALWQKNILFAVFAVVAAILVTTWGRRAPRIIAFTLSHEALVIDNKKTYYTKDVTGFAIVPTEEDPELLELVLKPKGKIAHFVKVLMPTSHHEDVKEILLTSVPEIEYEESTADRIARILRF